MCKPITRILAGTFIQFVFGLASLSAQDLASPLDIPLYLSGNFGELRNNHFHSGIDFKTQGVTGHAVRAVDDGFISRIGVSPYGYGNALYLDHPNGKTSVYGHLDRFAPQIEALVRDSQYQRESFTMNLYLPPQQIPVKKGEQIAWSGNSGSSGGPHLHLEIRDTPSQRILDPLPCFKDRIRDTRPPEIRELMLFPSPNKGVVNENIQNQKLKIIRNKAGEQQLEQPITAWGLIGVGLKAYDRMDETDNIYGVYEIALKVDDDEVYHSLMDRFSFDDTRYLNTFIDWNDWIEHNSFFMKSFTDPGNFLGINRAPGNGMIRIQQEKTYHLEYTLKDVYNNTTTFRFEIQGKQTALPQVEHQGQRFPFDQDNTFAANGVNLQIRRKNLYVDLDLQVQILPGPTSFSPLYAIGHRTPLHTYCPLTLDITDNSYPDPSKYGIVSHWKNKKKWLGGKYNKGKITAQIRELGEFFVEIDTIPPVITPLNEEKWKTTGRITFKITDELSGIQTWRGTLDGRFALFEYDAKTNHLSYTYDPKRMKKGKQTLHLRVTDSAGNRSEFRKTIHH
jgi:murein DD-endopeptidase MepM/ murein hydrolase activator NlpD